MVVAEAFTPLPQVSAHGMLIFLLQLSALLALALVMGRLATKLRMPAVVGELLAGVLIGPSILGHLSPGMWNWLFPSQIEQAHLLDAVAYFGVLLLVGITGAHLDLNLVRRRGVTAAKVSLSGLVIPLGLGIAVGFLLPAVLLPDTTTRPTFAMFLGVAMCVSAIPVIAKTLLDMKLIHRNVGQLALAAAMVDDAVGWFLLSVVSAMALGRVDGWNVVVTLGALVAFVLVAAVLGRPLVRAVFRLAGRSADSGPSAATAVVVILVGATCTHALGLEAVFGAFVAGALMGAPGMGKVLPPERLAPLRTFVMWIAAPIFLATAGLRVDLVVLADPTILLAAVAVLSVAIIGKFVGAYIGGSLSRLTRRESLALGASMNARGVVEVVVALAGLRLGVLNTTTYTIIVLVAVITSLMAPPILAKIVAGIDQTAEEDLRRTDQERWSGATVEKAIDDRRLIS